MKRIFLLAVLLMGCETPEETVGHFKYTKDPRTHECFALYAMSSNQASMTYVPCTDEVEKAIRQDYGRR